MLQVINLILIPSSITIHTQPLDQSIIANFKSNYRIHILHQLICSIDKKEVLHNISVLQGMHLIHEDDHFNR